MAKKRLERDDLAPKDVLGNIKEGAIDTKTHVDALDMSLKALAETGKKIKASIGKAAFGSTKGMKDFEKLARQANVISKEKLKIDKDVLKLKAQLSEQTKQQNKELRTEVKATQELTKEQEKNLGTLQKIELRNQKLRAERSRLNLETAKGRGRLRQINAELDKNNKIIERNSDRMKKQRLGIGRYQKALQGLTGTLAKLGLSFGAFQLIRGSFSTISEFETVVADLSAITGAVGDDLDFLKQQSIDMSREFGISANEVVEAFKLAGSARPELLQNGEALSDLTQKAIILSKASGDDLPTSINNLAGTLNSFDRDASEASEIMDILANASQKGAKEVPFLTEAFTKFGGIAASNNVQINEAAAAIEFLGKKIPDASMAGTNFRNILLKLSAPGTLPKKAIESLDRLGINTEILSDKTLPLNERLSELTPLLEDNDALTLTFGKQNVLAAQTLIQNADAVGKFSDELNKSGTAQEQMLTKSKTLGEAVNRLGTAWDAAILNMNEAGGVGEKLAAGVDFLADNLEEIIKWILRAARAFVVFKTAMFAIKMAERFKEWRAFNAEVKKTGGSAKSATSGIKNFGQALKGAGIALAVSALIELGAAFIDAASGAKLFREELEEYRKFEQIFDKQLEGRLGQIDRIFQDEKKLIETDLAEGTIKKAEAMEREEAAINKASAATRELLKGKRSELEMLKLGRQNWMKNGKIRDDLTIKEEASRREQERMIATRVRHINELKEYLRSLGGERHQLDLATASTKSNSAAKEENTKKTKNLKEATEQLDALQARITAQLELEAEAYEFNLEQHQQYVEDIIQQEEERARRTGEVNGDLIKRILEDEKRLRDERINAVELQEIESAANPEEVALATQRADQARIKSQQEYEQALKGSLGRLEKAQEEYADKTVDENKRIKEEEDRLAAERFETQRQAIDLLTNYFIAQTDKRIAKIDEEIEAHEKEAERLKELANEGNIEAKESIAEENRLKAQAEAEKAELERRKQRILLVSSILQAYNSNLEAGDDSGTAFTKAITSQAVLQQFIAGIGSFYDGTEDTGTVTNPLDAQGGRLAVLHNNERVLTASQNKKIGDYTNDQVASIMEQRRLGHLVESSQIGSGWDSQLLSDHLMSVSDKLDKVNQTIADKPVNSVELGKIVGATMEIIEKTQRGRDVSTTTIKVRPR